MSRMAGRFADLRLRIVSGVALGALAIGLLWLGGAWSAGLIAFLAGAMAWEWRAMTRAPAATSIECVVAPVSGIAGAAVLMHIAGWPLGALWLVVILTLSAGADALQGHASRGLWLLGGGLYIGVACLAFLSLRGFEPHGFLTALWIILVVAASDIGGYFAGRVVGGPKLWPSVSPKKTWAGLGGGLALAFLLGGVFSWATTGTYFQEVCTVSAIAALLAQLGDLAESAAKRHFGAKDSGRLIPGHGGALDRFDGLMAATLVAALVTHWRGQTVFIW